jgi:D-beta-D-heptose 7-phosphate kinase/D-beta-D-heptose 1-phosphate adenosyltransferase
MGDIMLDKYLFGEVNRMSPEAPVPVFDIKEEINKPGGAANVAVNLSSLGQEVNLLSTCASDINGKILLELVNAQNNIYYKIPQKRSPWKTITKTRIMCQNQQLMRIDNEYDLDTDFRLGMSENFIWRNIVNPARRSDAIIISDYNKGLIDRWTPDLIEDAIKNKIPVFVDPKNDNYHLYRGATCITPNLKEFNRIMRRMKGYGQHFTCEIITEYSFKIIEKGCRELISKYKFQSILVTLGEHGMLLVEKNKKDVVHIKATTSKEVFDVTGAGDTVISALCATYLSSEKKDLAFAANVASIAAGEVIKKIGAQSISADELASKIDENINLTSEAEEEYFSKLDALDDCNKIIKSVEDLTKIVKIIRELGFTIGFTNGCFDILHRGHNKYLDQARKAVDFLIIGINDDKSVKKLKGKGRPINILKDRMDSLNRATFDNAFIINFSEPTPIKLIKKIKPDILIKGGDYKANEIVGSDFVTKNNGEIKIIPFVKGCSTTNIIKKINKSSD